MNFRDSEIFFITRTLVNDEVEQYLLAFYLSTSSKSYETIKSFQSKFAFFNENITINSLLSEFSLLDLFISVFGEIDDSKIINIKKYIDQLIQKDKNVGNIEFLIRSEKSIIKLCTRNIFFAF